MSNILHITYDMRIGGTEMVIRNIVDSCGAEHNCAIFCIEEPLGPWGEDLKSRGVTVASYARQAGFDKGLIKYLRAYIKQHNIDILHCHQYTPWVYGALAALGLKVKVVFTEHGRFYPDSTTWKRRLINPCLVRITDAFTAISQATSQALTDYEFIPFHKVQLIYNGIKGLSVNEDKANALRQSLQLDANHLIFGTISRFDPIKNHTMMISAFAEVSQQYDNARLLIVGDGEERSNIEQCISKYDLQDKVILVGYQSDPAAYLAMMDVFLLSSLSEGTSMTLLEAMSIGKPCVVTNAGGNPEIVIHDYNGVVTENDNAAEFAQGMMRLSEPSLRESMGRNGNERFNRHFTNVVMNNQFNKIYERLNG